MVNPFPPPLLLLWRCHIRTSATYLLLDDTDHRLDRDNSFRTVFIERQDPANPISAQWPPSEMEMGCWFETNVINAAENYI
jgi:hypothetical protein